MLELAARLLPTIDAGRPVAVATVVAVLGSAPRGLGASMAWDGVHVVGSVAGGCVEGAVLDAARAVLADGEACTVDVGLDDGAAWGVGLTCGGALRVHVQAVDAAQAEALRAAARGEAAGVALVLAGDPAGLEDRLAAQVRARVATGRPGLVTVACDGRRVEAFVDVVVPPARLVVVGAMEDAVALAAAAQVVGYSVTVCDARPVFATPERFPGAEVVVGWPPTYLASTMLDERSVVCVLSHDDRYDVDVLDLALRSRAGYVGAMGSRRTVERRVRELRERGVPDEALGRLHAPIGLDVGAATPAENAVSVLAEVLAVRGGTSGRPLRERGGPIHARADGRAGLAAGV